MVSSTFADFQQHREALIGAISGQGLHPVLAVAGRWDEAEEMWNLLNPMGRDWPRNMYRPGDAEQYRLEFMLFPQGRLTEEDLAAAELLARTGQNRASRARYGVAPNELSPGTARWTR